MIWYGSIISLTITCLCFSGERISLFIKPAINTRSVCRRIPRRCLVRCMHQRFCCKMFEKQATVSTQQCQRGARLAAYSISCFPAAFSRRFRYPNPSPQAFPFSLPFFPAPFHSVCIRLHYHSYARAVRRLELPSRDRRRQAAPR